LWPDYYLDVTERADRQFADLMEVMRRRGVLDNAIVVVYSDHGESFGKALESLVPVDGLVAALGASPRWGHGSTVFSLHQYKVVLAMKGYGAAANLLPRGREITAPASVMDIAPTLTQLVGATTEQPFDGVSLLPLLAAQGPLPAEFAKRVRFTETEYNPVGVANEEGEMNLSGILEAAKMYRIDPQTDRIAVREDQAMPMLSFRQYAAIGNELLLAAVPFNRDGLSHQIMVLNKSGGIPILMGGNPEPDDSEELHLLWATMQTHLAGIVPTGEQIADAVARTTVATSGQ
jgi:hypothetical protein